MSADIHIQQGNALCGQNTECVNIRTRGQQGNRQAQSFGLREFASNSALDETCSTASIATF